MLIFFALLIGVTSAANIICTDYGKGIGGGGAFGGYYVRPVPKKCRQGCNEGRRVVFTSAVNVICTDYGKDLGGGGGAFGGYYVRPVPTNCRFQGYSPQFRIERGQPQCKGGWKQWKNKCYFLRGNMNWRDGEEFCNRHQAHIWQPNDREEFEWVENNVMRHDDWHWLGTVCNSKGQSRNVADFFTASGEDMREIQKKLNAKMADGHHINNHSHPCMLVNRRSKIWRWMYHHQGCNEGRRVVCEAPMVK
eukprot:sb/3468802/